LLASRLINVYFYPPQVTMKKIIAGFLCLIITHTGSAQLEWGLFGGPQMTSARYFVNNQKQSTSFKQGFNLGIGGKMPFQRKLYFTPAFYYSMKGYKVSFTQFVYPPDTAAKDNNTTIHTVELAPLLEYDFSDNASHCFIRFGPSLDFQVHGTEKYHLANGTLVNHTMKIASDGDYGLFGANLVAEFGFESSKGIFVMAHYGHGVGSINNADGGPRIYHQVLALSIGYYFNKEKSFKL
jgi:hypothetical protein